MASRYWKPNRLTADQVSVHQRAPICVIRSVAEGLALFGVTS